MNAQLADIDSRPRVEQLVEAFYARVLVDPLLAPIFLDVAAVDLERHLRHIEDYWCKLLLGETDYRRHTMNIHRELHGQRPLREEDYQRWLELFVSSVDANFCGPRAERAKQVATNIAGNMQNRMPPP